MTRCSYSRPLLTGDSVRAHRPQELFTWATGLGQENVMVFGETLGGVFKALEKY